jgi:hypothetical protein
MARMIPSLIQGDLPPGEISFYEGLARAPETAEWTVLFRQEMVNTGGREREIDFLVLIPGQGIVVVEVKSNSRIERRDGTWYFGNYPPDPIGPFRKTNDRKHQIARAVIEHDSRLAKFLPVARLVVFTHSALRTDNRSFIDWHPYEFCDGALYAKIGPVEAVLRALEPITAGAIQMHGAEPVAQATASARITRIANLICPDFVGIESAGIRSRFRNEELCRLTQAQSSALNGLRKAPRVVITGYAGSGKTSLAVQTAKELADEGKRVGLFCFNNALGAHLKEMLSSSPISFVGTAHKYAQEVLSYQPSEDDARLDWSGLIADASSRMVANAEQKFDAVVLDEAQDFYLGNLALIDLIDVSLDGGLANGTYRMFGDFMHQTLYKGFGGTSTEYLDLIEGAPITYELLDNCRNTRQVASFAEAVGSLHPGYKQVLRSGDGGLQVRPFSGDSGEASELIGVLENLKSRGFSAAEIVILTIGTSSQSIISNVELFRNAPYALKELRGGLGGDSRAIAYTTVRKFKGLEAPIVILIGLPRETAELEAPEIRDILYVAATRSLHTTIVLTPEEIAPSIASWIASRTAMDIKHV